MRPGSRLGNDPLSRARPQGPDAVLRNILEPAAPAADPCADALTLAGERFSRALETLLSLAVRAGLLPEDEPQDRTTLLLMRLTQALRLGQDSDGVDMAAYLSGVSGPWTLRAPEAQPPLALDQALALALGLAALIDWLRACPECALSTLALCLEQPARGVAALRLHGPAEAFPQDPDPLGGNRGAGLKNLARRGLLSVRALSFGDVREVRLDASLSL